MKINKQFLGTDIGHYYFFQASSAENK